MSLCFCHLTVDILEFSIDVPASGIVAVLDVHAIHAGQAEGVLTRREYLRTRVRHGNPNIYI